jgi:hypothetical protein
VYLTGIAAIVSIMLSFILIGHFKLGILGLCISLLTGRMVMTFGLPMILNKKIGEEFNAFKQTNIRPFVVFVGGTGLALFFQPYVVVGNWFELIGFGALVSLTCLVVFWFLAFEKPQKEALKSNASKIRFLKIKER